MYIASQIIETVTLIITIYAYHLKTKKGIFKGMCIANILDITHYLFLNAYSRLVTKVIDILSLKVQKVNKNAYICLGDTYVYEKA